MYSYVTSSKRVFFAAALFLLAFLTFTPDGYAQTQKPSVTTGVTFQWSDTQANNNDPATIYSVTINGEVFQSFAVPSMYNMTRVGPVGHNINRILENGATVNNNSSNIDWPADALAAFQDQNLNHYMAASSNGDNICNDFTAAGTTDAQMQSLYYSPGIPSNDGGIFAITDRNANNCIYISVYGEPAGGGAEQFLGDTFVRPNSGNQWGPLFNPPAAGVDYWNSGREVENGGTIGMALFLLDDIAPVGSTITRIDVTAATKDHFDGKVFLMQRYALPKTEIACLDTTYNGNLNGSNLPAGSTFTLVSGPTPAGQSFNLNSDGTYDYTPTAGYLGDVTFEYQVCLPAPNSGICDTNTATITYVTAPNNGCPCNSGSADGPLLQNN